jgi:hypothetical protein
MLDRAAQIPLLIHPYFRPADILSYGPGVPTGFA